MNAFGNFCMVLYASVAILLLAYSAQELWKLHGWRIRWKLELVRVRIRQTLAKWRDYDDTTADLLKMRDETIARHNNLIDQINDRFAFGDKNLKQSFGCVDTNFNILEKRILKLEQANLRPTPRKRTRVRSGKTRV